MSSDAPTFEEFVRPLVGDAAAAAASTPLSEQAAGDFKVLEWLDDLQERYSAEVEAELVTRWDQATLLDVYALLFPDADADADAAATEAGS